jgi:hypothetical protein
MSGGLNLSPTKKEGIMSGMKRWILLSLFLVIISPLWLPLDAGSQGHKSKHGGDGQAASGAGTAVTYPPMPGPGKKVPIGNDYYLIYGFDKKPKLGTMIMKVEVFAKDGKKDTSFEVKADSGMPSMRGAHESGERSFKLSNKGDYLLPIDIVMPGGWEIRLSLLKEGKIIFRGSYQFEV